jgi:hypothetical protein
MFSKTPKLLHKYMWLMTCQNEEFWKSWEECPSTILGGDDGLAELFYMIFLCLLYAFPLYLKVRVRWVFQTYCIFVTWRKVNQNNKDSLILFIYFLTFIFIFSFFFYYLFFNIYFYFFLFLLLFICAYTYGSSLPPAPIILNIFIADQNLPQPKLLHN